MDTVQYTVSPDKVTLVGEKDVLDTIDAIVLDTLYLPGPPALPEPDLQRHRPGGYHLAENVGPVTVTIVVTGVTERNVTVTAFNCENVPEGFSAVPVTESLNILPAGPGGRNGPDHRGGPAHYRGPQRYHGAGGSTRCR